MFTLFNCFTPQTDIATMARLKQQYSMRVVELLWLNFIQWKADWHINNRAWDYFYLDARFREVDLHGEIFPGEDVRIVCLRESALELLQLEQRCRYRARAEDLLPPSAAARRHSPAGAWMWSCCDAVFDGRRCRRGWPGGMCNSCLQHKQFTLSNAPAFFHYHLINMQSASTKHFNSA